MFFFPNSTNSGKSSQKILKIINCESMCTGSGEDDREDAKEKREKMCLLVFHIEF